MERTRAIMRMSRSALGSRMRWYEFVLRFSGNPTPPARRPSSGKRKARERIPGSQIIPGDVLLSHEVYLEVPSGLKGLTAVFGMGTGVAPSLESPGKPITSFRSSALSFQFRHSELRTEN